MTASRNDVDYVVTDYGVAEFRRTVRNRMKALIAVAHPAFQEMLERNAYEIYNVKL